MWLIRNGVDEETAWAMSPMERLARCVVFGQFESLDFDWKLMRWKERKD